MSLGKATIGVIQYRLPQKRTVDLDVDRDIFFVFKEDNGHTFVRNETSNIVFTYNVTTGHMSVEGISTDRYLNFSYRDFPPGSNADGHMIENI